MKKATCGSGVARRGGFYVVITAVVTENPGTGEKASAREAGHDLLLGLFERDTCKNETYLLAFTRKSTESHKTKIKLESH